MAHSGLLRRHAALPPAGRHAYLSPRASAAAPNALVDCLVLPCPPLQSSFQVLRPATARTKMACFGRGLAPKARVRPRRAGPQSAFHALLPAPAAAARAGGRDLPVLPPAAVLPVIHRRRRRGVTICAAGAVRGARRGRAARGGAVGGRVRRRRGGCSPWPVPR